MSYITQTYIYVCLKYVKEQINIRRRTTTKQRTNKNQNNSQDIASDWSNIFKCIISGIIFKGVRTGKGCKEALSNSFTLPLQCSNDEWIHVEHEAYGDGDGDAATCRLKSAAACSKLLTSSRNGLVVSCNGKQSCFEAMTVQTINNCNVTDPAAEVKYNCIKGSMNMCSPVTTSVNGSVYLHSPGFPDSVGVNSSCVVRITGQNVEVTLLEQRKGSGMLNISSDVSQLWKNVNVNQYNRVLSGPAAEIVIVYDNHDQNGSNIWIRVAGSGQMNMTISGEIMDASTTTTSTQRLPSSQSTSSPGTSDTTTTETKTRAHSTATASMTTMTSTDGRTSHSTGNTATQLPSKSTMVSTAVSTADKNKSTMAETVTVHPATSTTTATAPTTPKSATVIATNMTTKGGKESSTTTPSPEPGRIILVASAVSGCVVTILIVVIAVVLCRKHMKKSRSHETPGKGDFKRPLELSPMNPEKHQNGFGQNETCNQHFVLDPEFVAGNGEPINTEPGHRAVSQDLYAKAVPLGSAADMYDKSTLTVTNSEADPNVISDPNGSRADSDHQGISAMTENDLYGGRFADLREAMVDNVVYDKFDLERDKEYVQDESDTSPNNTKQSSTNNCEMIENDVYDGTPHAANENNETRERMDDNRLYHKSDFDKTKEPDACLNHVKLSWKDGMVENDVYERGPPHLDGPVGSIADTDNPVGYLNDWGVETSEGMGDNGLHDKFDFDRERESLQDESDASPNHGKLSWKGGMVENDVYERGPP
ncbi:uncharacterized protein [Haliotis asinina]|uniref:uncharacterized protein isoform X2 n=1 Tax=Haliotis asinina TaxID=109174 RepID=UPI00353262D4